MSAEADRTIYIFAPHPDDETLACGGTIVKKTAQGYEIKIAVMTDGSHSHSTVLGIWSDPTPGELAEIRKQELFEATGILGVPPGNVFFLGAEDGFLSQDENDMIEEVKTLLQKDQTISEIYLPHPQDQHKDHRATNRIVLKALKDLNINPDIYFYVVWEEPNQRYTGSKVAIDISEGLSAKKKAVLKYKSQIESMFPNQEKSVLTPSFVERFMNDIEEVFWKKD